MPLTFASRFAASQRWADPLAERLQPLIRRAVGAPPVRNFLDGVWLGAPLHPGLTDDEQDHVVDTLRRALPT